MNPDVFQWLSAQEVTGSRCWQSKHACGERLRHQRQVRVLEEEIVLIN